MSSFVRFNLSSELANDVLQSLANEAVQVIGFKFDPNGPRRTEIKCSKGGATLVLHKNPGGGHGTYTVALRANLLVIERADGQVRTLVIAQDPTTAYTNPLYSFKDGVETVGVGHGQQMDMVLAAAFVDGFHGGGGDHVDQKVITWINQQIFS